MIKSSQNNISITNVNSTILMIVINICLIFTGVFRGIIKTGVCREAG